MVTTFEVGRVYKFCFWARLDPESHVHAYKTRIDIIYYQNFRPVASADIVIYTEWEQVCFDAFEPIMKINGWFATFLGFAELTFHIDDVSLTHTAAGPAPEGRYELYHMDAPIATFEAINIPFTQKYFLHNQPAISNFAPYSAAVVDFAGNGSVRRLLRGKHGCAQRVPGLGLVMVGGGVAACAPPGQLAVAACVHRFDGHAATQCGCCPMLPAQARIASGALPPSPPPAPCLPLPPSRPLALQAVAFTGKYDQFCNGPVLLEDGRVLLTGGSGGGYLPDGWAGLQASRHVEAAAAQRGRAGQTHDRRAVV